MRRPAVLLVFATFMLAASAGTAMAAVLLSGTARPDVLTGTNEKDLVSGRGGADYLYGRGGDDLLRGEAGVDRIKGDAGKDILGGGPGNDFVNASDGVGDLVSCDGGAADVFFADRLDTVAPNCEIDGKKALKGGVLATFDVGGERFQVFVTNPRAILDLRALRRGESTANIPSGRVLPGPGRVGHNAPYSWHLDPEDISMADMTIEVCDAEPSYVEENVDEFVGNVGRYCPWSARLVELQDYAGEVTAPPVQTPGPITFPDEG